MVFGVLQGGAQITYKTTSYGACANLGAKRPKIKIENSTKEKYLKCPQGLHHHVELVKMILTDILFASFGVRMEEIQRNQIKKQC